MGLGRRDPAYVHLGGCHVAGKRSRGVDRDQALRALTAGPTPNSAFWNERPAQPEGREGDRAGLCGNPPRPTPAPHARTGHSGAVGTHSTATGCRASY
ncbi:DUF6233 domain-containing protein [Streptomyces sp. NPDC048527]|uniref:DUF6233 domain-containing protein n=1 Tax=Streptomyces sp. NPDC048527 TaxID=3365568 RepID=UPI0037172F72